MLAYLRQGETYVDLAGGFGIGVTTVFGYVREALDVLAAMATPLNTAIEIARRKAFVILDGTLLRIDRVGMTGGRDRPFYSKFHCQQIAPEIFLVTYTLQQGARITRRSTLWQHTADGWKALFHQGTEVQTDSPVRCGVAQVR